MALFIYLFIFNMPNQTLPCLRAINTYQYIQFIDSFKNSTVTIPESKPQRQLGRHELAREPERMNLA